MTCPGHRTAHACGANVNLQDQPPDSSLAFSSHARDYKQDPALPLRARSLSGHQISQALGTVKIAPESTTSKVLLCQARVPARTLRDPWPGGWSKSRGKARNGSPQVTHRGMVSTGGTTKLRPQNGRVGVLNTHPTRGVSPTFSFTHHPIFILHEPLLPKTEASSDTLAPTDSAAAPPPDLR